MLAVINNLNSIPKEYELVKLEMENEGLEANMGYAKRYNHISTKFNFTDNFKLSILQLSPVNSENLKFDQFKKNSDCVMISPYGFSNSSLVLCTKHKGECKSYKIPHNYAFVIPPNVYYSILCYNSKTSGDTLNLLEIAKDEWEEEDFEAEFCYEV